MIFSMFLVGTVWTLGFVYAMHNLKRIKELKEVKYGKKRKELGLK